MTQGGAALATIPAFGLDPERLIPLAERWREEYPRAEPFPHVVIDDFLPEEVLDHVLAEFPSPDGIPWRLFTDQGHTHKLATDRPTLMGPFTRHLLNEFNASVMVDFLERLTGIEGLVPDPHLAGGGMHQIEAGGFLHVHADFNVYERLRLDRRLNLLLYLNRDWEEEYGGHLELWTRDMSRCARRILPVFNRMVVFSTSDISFHGHPQALACPPGRTRKSLAVYYYSNGRPAGEASAPHSTLYQEPGVQPAHTGGTAREPAAPAAPLAPPGWRGRLRPFLPPAAVDLALRAERRLRRPR
ncbi:MAG TPA: 2OG-Fe(II) oxygenase [Candidatus Dormibacteraeota bacterium]|jgi:hypothetical protein|nr:2OG-Fe(II) oxygenase [Candidatus Dormibacteraeota bacterium]